MDVPGRVARLRAGFEAAGCEALLVTHLTNIRYLTGFSGSSALLLVQPDSLTFVTDGRYEEQAAGQLAAAGVEADIEIGRTLARQQELVTEASRGTAPARSRVRARELGLAAPVRGGVVQRGRSWSRPRGSWRRSGS